MWRGGGASAPRAGARGAAEPAAEPQRQPCVCWRGGETRRQPCTQSFIVLFSTVAPVSQESAAAPADAAKLLQSCSTLCDPIDGSPPGPAIPGKVFFIFFIYLSTGRHRLFLHHSHCK